MRAARARSPRADPRRPRSLASCGCAPPVARRQNDGMRRLLAASAVLLASLGAGLAAGHPPKGAPKCAVFPKSNPWNQRVDKLPLVGNSAAIVGSIGASGGVHADFGSGLYEGAPIGIPFTTVSRAQKKVRVSFDYSDESDRGPYPIPKNAPIEGGRNSDG